MWTVDRCLLLELAGLSSTLVLSPSGVIPDQGTAETSRDASRPNDKEQGDLLVGHRRDGAQHYIRLSWLYLPDFHLYKSTSFQYASGLRTGSGRGASRLKGTMPTVEIE